MRIMKGKFCHIKALYILLLFLTTIAVSCTDTSNPQEISDNAQLRFLISPRLAGNELIYENDGAFSSLAIFIFNQSDGFLEYSSLLPSFSPEYLNNYSLSVEVSSQPKVIYAIANYAHPEHTFSPDISSGLTIDQIENMTVNTTTLNGGNIPMVGKVEVQITENLTTVQVPMERLYARLDIYMFKNQKLLNNNISITSLSLVNQARNSLLKYKTTEMISPLITGTMAGELPQNTVLEEIPGDISDYTPEQAFTHFYSYQNIVPADTPNTSFTPYLLFGTEIDGVPFTYRAWITDFGQNTYKYSLLRNNVYRVIAMIDKPDTEIIVNTTVLPWESSDSQIGMTIDESDYTLQPFGGNDLGALSGLVFFPYRQNNVIVNESTSASYSFSLTAPAGMVWTASLTNGLDFQFSSQGTTPGKLAVSKGIARNEPYEIKVVATKPWDNVNVSTYMYIIANGQKLVINPLRSDGTRQFPGSNDTDILITQVAYEE